MYGDVAIDGEVWVSVDYLDGEASVVVGSMVGPAEQEQVVEVG